MNAATYIVTDYWEAQTDYTDFNGTCPGGVYEPTAEYTIGYRSTHERDFPYYRIPYVYGGTDSENTAVSNINSGMCPGGYRIRKIIDGEIFHYGTTKNHYDHGCNTEAYLAGSDCSAFVTLHCWNTARYTTTGIEGITLEITPEELKKGDVLNRAGYHVMLFLSWADYVGGTCNIYEQTGNPGYTLSRQWSYNKLANLGYSARSPFPLFSDFTPAEEEIINDATPEIKIKVKSGTNILANSIVVKIDENSVSPTLSPSTDVKEILVSYTPTQDLSDGQHEVYIYAMNSLNLEDSATHQFTIDTAPPEVRLFANGCFLKEG
jgi:hypothetical protein